jgi:prophage regulatory protein
MTNQEKVLAALAFNQQKPKHRFIRKPEVKLRTGLKNTSLWRAMKDDGFPKSVILNNPTKKPNGFGKGRNSNAVAWVESEVEQWMESRMNERS